MSFKQATYELYHKLYPSSETTLNLLEIILDNGTVQDVYNYANNLPASRTATVVASYYRLRKTVLNQTQQEQKFEQ